jgi:hypothetical protein
MRFFLRVNGVSSAKMAAKSEWHRDAAVTFTNRSLGPGFGTGTSWISRGAPDCS